MRKSQEFRIHKRVISFSHQSQSTKDESTIEQNHIDTLPSKDSVINTAPEGVITQESSPKHKDSNQLSAYQIEPPKRNSSVPSQGREKQNPSQRLEKFRRNRIKSDKSPVHTTFTYRKKPKKEEEDVFSAYDDKIRGYNQFAFGN